MPEHIQPLCSVCIANYNGIAVLDACLKSVNEQDCGFPVEIIVHDDASTDGSVEFIRAKWPGVGLITSRENVGFCISNNRMVAQARGQYILLLNNDAELLPDALRTLAEEAVRLGSPAILGLPQYDAQSGKLIDIGSLFDPFLNTMANLDPNRGSVGAVIGACLWLPRALWHELGGFPEWFGSLAEDTYLCCLARLRGYPVRAIGRSGFRHWVGASLGGGKAQDGRLATTRERRALSERNKTFVMVLTYPPLMFRLLFPLHALLVALEGLILSAAKRDGRLWRDIYGPCLQEVWRARGTLLAMRRDIQRARRISLLDWLAVFRPIPYKLRMLLRHGMPDVR